MRKVELAVLKPWITKNLIELLGFEDDVLIEYVFGILEDDDNKVIPFLSLSPSYRADRASS